MKNVPNTAKELEFVKHLIKIQPVCFPDGLPVSEDDFLNFRLLPNGNFVRRGNSPFRTGKPIDLSECTVLQVAPPSNEGIKDVRCCYFLDLLLTIRVSSLLFFCIFQLETTKKNPRYLTRAYLRGWHNQRWQRHQLFSEFFTTKYKYRLNQDGQEYRYNGLWRLDDAMQQSLSQRTCPDGTYRARNNSRFEADWGTYPWAFY